MTVSPKNEYSQLRRKAEDLLSSETEKIENLSPSEIKKLYHELRVHQAELEMQNDEMRLKQEELESLRNEYQDLFDLAPVGYLILDQNGIVLGANLTLCQLLNRERKSLVKRPFIVHLIQEDFSVFFSFLENIFSGGKLKTTDIRLKRKNGKFFHAQLYGILVRTNNNQEPQCRISIRDVTVSKKAEETSLMLTQAVESVAEGCIITDPNQYDNPTIYANRAFEQMTGYSVQETIGQNCRFLQGKDTNPQVISEISDAIQERRTFQGEILNYRKDNTPFWNYLTISPIFSETGELRYFVGIQNDVTERNQDRDKLKLAKDLAEHANRSKSEFLANMSHEIRTPLNAIVGFSQLLLRRAQNVQFPDNSAQYLESISISGKHLSELINDILDLSKIESGKMFIDEENFDLTSEIRGIFQIYRSMASEKQVNLEYKIDENIPQRVFLDRTKINQIIMNLLANAIKFTPEGKSVMLLVQRCETDGILFQVNDEGIGIEKERQSAIFSAFEQADKTMTRRFGGTGLGLAITKKIVELLKGKISVESEVNQGSTFSVILPLKEADPVTDNDEQESFTGNRFAEDSRILIAEDNLMNQELIKAVFEELELPVYLANDGIEAVEMAKTIKPELIFMDIHMPKMDGLHASKEILEISELKNTPIIALSADAFAEEQKFAYEAGIRDYLIKPLVMEKLLPILNKFLRPRQ
ncbi:MAG: PAS domain-containing protein [SAR324 cluster bacterium]|nr:PAS domain-containing protein [SAR324 cluster bacterium]